MVRCVPVVGGAIVLTLAVCDAVVADGPDKGWPQWGGVTRDFRIAGGPELKAWGSDGPRELWRRPLGDGNSAIAVAGEHLYTAYRRGDDEVVVALDRATGRTIWESAAPQPTWKGFLAEYGYGPHTTPLIVGERLYTIGIGARLRCLSRSDGALLWERDLWDQFDPTDYEFGPAQLGYSASPLAFGRSLIAVAGGRGSSVVALDLESGETLWQSQSFPPGFASPLLIEVGGQRQLVVFAADRVAGLDPTNGRLLWEHSHETPYMVNASTPVWGDDDLLVVSSAYDAGSRALRLRSDSGRTEIDEVWASRQLEVHHQSFVRLGNVIHGSSGDFGPAFLTGTRADSGEQLYKMRGFAKANLLAIGERILLLDEDGVLALVAVDGDEPRILARAQIFENRSWTVPSFVDGVLYARDREEIVALDLTDSAD